MRTRSSKSMGVLQQVANGNAGDRPYVAMADTFRLDFVGTKAGIEGASVVMGSETGMRVGLSLWSSFEITRAGCARCQ